MGHILQLSQMAVAIAFNTALATVGACFWGLIVYALWKSFKSWRNYSKHPAAVRLRRFRNARRKAKRERRAHA
jgi:hypothetical protein